ncbi:MAG: hypothetical protein HY231_07505 [Acidobacteria bacterium]|nr:hypothetical protein [Acidobacteriota bacterium]
MSMKKIIATLMLIGLLSVITNAQAQLKSTADPQLDLKSTGEQLLNAKAKTITGTWLLTITPDEPGAPSFPGLYTFTSDGIALFSSVGPPIPGLGNPGHGVWEKTGANTFVVTWKQFTFDDIFTTNGALVVKSNITLTGADTFTSRDTGKILDLDGNLIVSISGSIQARRMKIE